MEPINFFVPGKPVPGGSKKAFALRRRDGSLVTRPNGSPIINVTEDAKGNKEWRANAAFFARQAYQGSPLDGPIALQVEFVMPRTKDHFGTGKKSEVLRTDAPKFHTKKPDATKLLRSLEDALTQVLWVDDSRICWQAATKVYGDKPGAHVRVCAAAEVDRAVENVPELFGAVHTGNVHSV